jgi:hypothetical protein
MDWDSDCQSSRLKVKFLFIFPVQKLAETGKLGVRYFMHIPYPRTWMKRLGDQGFGGRLRRLRVADYRNGGGRGHWTRAPV